MSRCLKLVWSCGAPVAGESWQIVEIVRPNGAVCEDEDPAHRVSFRDARAGFVAGGAREHAGDCVSNLLERQPLRSAPVPQFQNDTLRSRFPLWLSHRLALWQYANMETGQIGYLRRVANDTNAPNRIRELREARGLSQKALAELANVTPSALNKLEMGTRGLDQDWMRRLAPLLAVPPAELLPVEDNPDILTPEEREMVSRLRAANEKERETFGKVADAILPYRSTPERSAA